MLYLSVKFHQVQQITLLLETGQETPSKNTSSESAMPKTGSFLDKLECYQEGNKIYIKNLFGPGANDGELATDLDQATGVERLELLAKIAGEDIFGVKPPVVNRPGTMKDPIIVEGTADSRIVGCTGKQYKYLYIMTYVLTLTRLLLCLNQSRLPSRQSRNPVA